MRFHTGPWPPAPHPEFEKQYMDRPFFIQQNQPDELVVHLCRVLDAIRDAMDTSQRRGQSNITQELGTRLRQIAELVDRVPTEDDDDY